MSTTLKQVNKSHLLKRNLKRAFSLKKKKKRKILGNDLGGFVGRVMVGDRHRPTCIPAHSSKVVVGRSQGALGRGTFMVEETKEGNLPLGVGVNRTFVSPSKNGFVLLYSLTIKTTNVWLRQPLYAGDLWECDLEDWEYEPVLKRDRKPTKLKYTSKRYHLNTSERTSKLKQPKKRVRKRDRRMNTMPNQRSRRRERSQT